MRAWSVRAPGALGSRPLRLGERPVPVPFPDEVLVEVTACGLCRTDLHLAEGDLAPRRPDTVPGHQVVGRVVATGGAARRFRVGDRVGVAWLRRTCGSCRWCRNGAENLCPGSTYTGWDADGGFAEYTVVPEAFAYRSPASMSDLEVAPLLCAGIIGYRALVRAAVPPAGRLGIYGFGSSAHITAQVAMAAGVEVFVMTRGESGQSLARSLGATWVGGVTDQPPSPLDSAIIFAPAGELVPVALEALDRGGTLALAGIYMSAVPELDYPRHLFQERTIQSVTANTRADGEALLRIATRVPLDVHVTEYGFGQVDSALADLAADRVSGSVVITGFRPHEPDPR
ncbi:zinc-binding alcohol dehydrogenase family protein [Nocardioides sp.]|nr:zinc-dependent alcohol dehydrogenase family protein [Nocardioides sp.]THJ06222.1 zinc-binding alcohol dehydrogenase family protein [Nocardioides sp.]